MHQGLLQGRCVAVVRVQAFELAGHACIATWAQDAGHRQAHRSATHPPTHTPTPTLQAAPARACTRACTPVCSTRTPGCTTAPPSTPSTTPPAWWASLPRRRAARRARWWTCCARRFRWAGGWRGLDAGLAVNQLLPGACSKPSCGTPAPFPAGELSFPAPTACAAPPPAPQAVAKGVTDVELERAKSAAVSSVLMNLESRAVVAEDIGRQVLTYGHRCAHARSFAAPGAGLCSAGCTCSRVPLLACMCVPRLPVHASPLAVPRL